MCSWEHSRYKPHIFEFDSRIYQTENESERINISPFRSEAFEVAGVGIPLEDALSSLLSLEISKNIIPSPQMIHLPKSLVKFPTGLETHLASYKDPLLQEQVSAKLHSVTYRGLKLFFLNENNRSLLRD